MAGLRMWLPRLALAGAGLIAAVLLIVYVVLLQTVPPASGEGRIPGLERPVEIVRDREGVPHILAESLPDALAALGFAHAQDRLWQMESARRLIQGRLSELFGPLALDNDILMRTFDLDGHARRSFAALPAEAREKLEAYSRGVNAWIERDTALLEPRLPPEFLLLGHRPEPWHPADSVAVVKLLAMMLSNNVGHEMRRLRLAAHGLSPAEIADLLPIAQADGAAALPDLRDLLPLERVAAGPAALQTALIDGILGTGASNNWVLSGARTTGGKPLLANDPHLRLSVPSIWYFAHLSVRVPGKAWLDSVGGTVPGAPLVVLGRTGSVAWGFTNTGSDVQDVFIEKVNPDNAAQYLTPEGWRNFVEQPVTIRVKGAADHHVVRRTTRHGPVLPDGWRGIGSLLRPGHVAALAWTALSDEDTTIAAGLMADDMTSVAEFIAHQRLYIVPMQSMVVADTSGTVALIAPGRVPIRDPANAVGGRAPVPGWDARYDWKGFLPFSALPQVINPPSGAIGTANARIVPKEFPAFLTHDWESPWRQLRIDELLALRSKHTPADMVAMQTDVVSLADRRLKSLMTDLVRVRARTEVPLLDRLAAWDGGMRADAMEPLVFVAWQREAVRAIFEDDLGGAFRSFWDPHADTLIDLLEGRARSRDWCDDRRTPARETCEDVVAVALVRALAQLTWQFGPHRNGWRWGDAHMADGENRVLSAIPLFGALTAVKPPIGGGTYTINRGSVDFSSARPFAATGGASMRAIYDLAEPERSKFIHSTGQSGNPMSRHYADFAERWARGQYIEIATDRAAVLDRARGIWRLVGNGKP